MVLMVAQFFILAYSLIFDPVLRDACGPCSRPPPPSAIPISPFMLLDRVFAVPNLYESQFDPALIGMTPFSDGLHALFNFYNMAMLIVAVFIVLYYVVILVAETAQSGTPFGKRFDTIWAPIRLVVAVGLLVPVSFGYNSAQFIVLYSAKFGSSFATNAWTIYNQDIVSFGLDCGSGPSEKRCGLV
jgi:conjugal transfer/type IV secretion protein DotA/TraY